MVEWTNTKTAKVSPWKSCYIWYMLKAVALHVYICVFVVSTSLSLLVMWYRSLFVRIFLIVALHYDEECLSITSSSSPSQDIPYSVILLYSSLTLSFPMHSPVQTVLCTCSEMKLSMNIANCNLNNMLYQLLLGPPMIMVNVSSICITSDKIKCL